MANKTQDKEKRIDLIKLVDESKLNNELKKEIKSLIEELNNGDLDNLFKTLKDRLKQEEDNHN